MDIFSKTANRKHFRSNDLQKTAKKAKRPTNLKYGQISEIWTQNGQSGNPAGHMRQNAYDHNLK